MKVNEFIISLHKRKFRKGIILCIAKDITGKSWEYLHFDPGKGNQKWISNLPENSKRNFILCIEGPVIHKKKIEYKSVLNGNQNIKSITTSNFIFFTSKSKLEVIENECIKKNISTSGELWWEVLKEENIFQTRQDLETWSESYLKKEIPKNLIFNKDHSRDEVIRTTKFILKVVYPILFLLMGIGYLINIYIKGNIQSIEKKIYSQRQEEKLSKAQAIELQSKNSILTNMGFGESQEYSKIIDNISKLKPRDTEFLKLIIFNPYNKKYEVTLYGNSLLQENVIEFQEILKKELATENMELDKLMRLKEGNYQFELKFEFDEEI